MKKKSLINDNIMDFYDGLGANGVILPEGFRLINPFTGEQKEKVHEVVAAFYDKYYWDSRPRKIILGSSPARRGTAVTGVPFEDASRLYIETGIALEDFYINKASSNFLYDVMDLYGGCEKFYSDYYMNFVCPLGIVRKTIKGKEVNCNYYENKELMNSLDKFIISRLETQISWNFDRSVCLCIGSGENYQYLSRLNDSKHYFKKIIPLEHPRYIMQYNSRNKSYYIDKYLAALNDGILL